MKILYEYMKLVRYFQERYCIPEENFKNRKESSRRLFRKRRYQRDFKKPGFLRPISILTRI
jgi:hypothetical protein